MSGLPNLTPMQKIFQADPEQGKRSKGAWDQMWKQGITPWDGSGVQPALKVLIEEKWGNVKEVPWEKLVGGDALVAGMGRGYDAIYFASKGMKALGIDLSETAVEAAKKHLSEIHNPPKDVRFEQADFFTVTKPEGGFSLAYDFTFLCALPMDLKEPLGKRYAELIKPGGVLVTLMWPLSPVVEGGPPFHSPPSLYHQVFDPSFDLVYEYDVSPDDNGPTGPSGEKKMGVWVRKA